MIELKRQSFTTDSVNKENIMEIQWLNILFILIIAAVFIPLILYAMADFILDLTWAFQSKIDRWKSDRWKQKVGLKRKK